MHALAVKIFFDYPILSARLFSSRLPFVNTVCKRLISINDHVLKMKRCAINKIGKDPIQEVSRLTYSFYFFALRPINKKKANFSLNLFFFLTVKYPRTLCHSCLIAVYWFVEDAILGSTVIFALRSPSGRRESSIMIITSTEALLS